MGKFVNSSLKVKRQNELSGPTEKRKEKCTWKRSQETRSNPKCFLLLGKPSYPSALVFMKKGLLTSCLPPLSFPAVCPGELE
jgi:hypothetical protein